MRVKRIMRRLRSEGAGAVGVQVALLTFLFVGVSALAVDMGFAYSTRNRLQIMADASALAGASALPDPAFVLSQANHAAEQNWPVGAMGDVLPDADVVLGNWNSAARTFISASDGGSPVNAVQVTTRRQEANNNPMPSVLAGIFGIGSFDIMAVAVAWANGSDDCFRNGLVANGKLEAGSQDIFGVGACMHGQQGVEVGSTNHFQEGSVVSMPDLNLLQQGSGNIWDGELVEQELEALTDGEADDLIADIKATANGASEMGSLGAKPPWWDGTVTNHSGDFKNCNPTQGKLYRVTGVVDLSSCTGTLQNFGVYSDKEIKLGGGGSSSPLKIKNMFFASKTTIETASWIVIGETNFCDVGQGAIFFAAGDFLKFGSNIKMYGVQIIAGAKDKKLNEFGIDFGSNLETHGLAAQSAGYIKIGSDPFISVCDRADQVYPGTVNKVLQLVD